MPRSGNPDVVNLTLLMGEAAATAARMEAFVLRLNPEPKLPFCTAGQLAEMFIEEGRAEGVRGDVAWAQSLLETGYFRYGRIVTPDMNNYSGIGALYEDRPRFGARFDSPRLGVRAQIQHLKAYATTEPLVGDCVDPRFHLVLRGSAPYAEWLGAADNPTGRGWAFPGGGYGAHIVAILGRMLEG
ncbi:MAG: glucosaminidase domain-containing protein [Candidatus Dadabacteria bacterium]|nr:glucosaminidase domain-containing protein [Candidatus Dadabacteria bacterium]